MNTPPDPSFPAPPPLIPTPTGPAQPAAPEWSPEEREPIAGPWAAIEALLRQPRRVLHQCHEPSPGRLIRALALVALIGALGYGMVIGAFSGDTQLWAAPLKVAGGLFASALICLPSLYIFGCLGGSTAHLSEVAGRLAGAVALFTLLLLGFAPVAWVFSQSTESIIAMGALHLAFGVIATYFGLRFLHHGFSGPRQGASGGLAVWMVMFVLVMLQMTTALRPLLGTADTFLPEEKRFFLTHWRACIQESTTR